MKSEEKKHFPRGLNDSVAFEDVLALVARCEKKVIRLFELGDKTLRIWFQDRSVLVLVDSKDECCERRFMRTDDNLADFVGARLLRVELRDATRVRDYDRERVSEVQFLAVVTTKGEFVLSNHNVHNGFYGGFRLQASLE